MDYVPTKQLLYSQPANLQERLENLKVSVARAAKGKGWSVEQVRALYAHNARLIEAQYK